MDTLAKLQDWEELDAQLEDIVSAYYRTCHILERMVTDSSSVDAAPLERRMGDRYTRFIRPLSHSFASIARSRNNLRTPLHRMPTEVLGRIFEFVVDTDTRYMPMNVAIQTMYLSLHRLMGVCSVWRNVAQNHFPLWTLIPVVHFNTRSLSVTETWFSRSLERSGAISLRLAVSVGSLDINNLPIKEKLVSQAHRFRSINICASSLSTIESILKPILTAPAPKFLREISLCYEPPQGHNAQAPYYLFSSVTYPVLSAFEVALGFVGILRLKSVLPPPYSRCYSNLVELRLQDIRFGINTCFEQFLGTLSSATQLQSLDLISVLTSITHHHADDKRIMVRLPLLKHLYLENLDLNILESVFLTIEPGQYYTSLMMTQRCLLSVSLIGVIQDDLNRFRQVFKSSKIYTLLLKEHSPVFGPRRLHFILSCMPTVDTLSLDGQTLSHQYLLALTRPPNSSVPFPKLQTIYISRSIIDAIQDQAAFRNMLSSHPLQTLYLGGSFNMATAANSAEFLTDPGRCRVDIAGPDTWAILTRDWIKANIPNFTVWPHDVYGQLRSTEWELW